MKLAIGCDEAAYRLKVIIMEHLKEKHAEIEVTDFGVAQGNTVLYPNVAYTVADAVASGGSSGASCCAALASVCAFAPTRSRGSVRQCATTPIQRNEAARAITRRIMCMGERVIGAELAKTLVDTWLPCEFAGGGSAPKVAEISRLEQEHIRNAAAQ